MPSKSSRSVPFSQSSRSVVPNSAASTPAGSSTLSLPVRPSASASVALLALSVRAGGRARVEALELRLGQRRVFLGLEEGVLLHHLLDLLVQFQGRELQQPDRLLQLRRQREMLRQADLQRGFHVQALTLTCGSVRRGRRAGRRRSRRSRPACLRPAPGLR